MILIDRGLTEYLRLRYIQHSRQSLYLHLQPDQCELSTREGLSVTIKILEALSRYLHYG